ncbi:putative exported protein [Halobacteriovorax marinus SJ]|uniref:Exported protein n=1 Tax=Halobacteriovorax marinus (strain ATCC BAA-682 / DSM 15412 / SJ) TaxID=862908 RepID=E1WZR2_HALMS|nr:hypothetical protein [Halobacteriovorax marinus]CBW26248.1 putative exported protein [Halobacteriovorax marinus SJ]
MRVLIILLLSFSTYANDKNVIVEYKKYESFDLGNLEVKGQLLAPGDLSVKERDRKVFERALYEKFDFNEESIKDIRNLR